jgi:hypothetical protein
LGEQIVEGGKRPRRRAATGRDWTAKKEEKFLEALAESCNVTFACRAAGVSSSAAYRHRAADATFRAAWGRAVGVGYSQLEMMLLERALKGVEKPVKAGSAETMRHYDDRTALALLKHHRDSAAAADEEVPGAEHEEACERILARLARLKERLQNEIETKSALDGLALVRWFMARIGRSRRDG